jgi:uncharacterized protein
VTEGLAGTENQCLGVAEALGLHAVIKRISLHEPWKTLSPYLGFENARSFTPALAPPWPDLLIASGRKSIAAARFIKKHSAGKTFTVQIQDPRISPHHFDLVAVPAHDRLRAENVLVTHAAPNRITPEKLASGRAAFAHLESLPRPRVAVLIGGSSAAYTMTRAVSEKLASQLSTLQAGFMITASRRTGAENEQILRASLDRPPHVFWDGKGENPYFGFLGWADIMLVTADSTSMLSEAASTGKPVYRIDLEGGKQKNAKRIRMMHEHLEKLGVVRLFQGSLDPFSPPAPLADAQTLAAEIRARMRARGWIL